jgi:hypothetical protein
MSMSTSMGLILFLIALASCSAQSTTLREPLEGAAGNTTGVMEMAVAYLGTYLTNAMGFCEGAYYCLQDGSCLGGC